MTGRELYETWCALAGLDPETEWTRPEWFALPVEDARGWDDVADWIKATHPNPSEDERQSQEAM